MIWGFAGISGSFLVAVFSVNQLHATVPVYRLTFSQRVPRNARPHEVGEGRTVRLRWLHARIHVLHCRVCFPRRSRLRLDDQLAAQSPCLAILVPLGMWCLIGDEPGCGVVSSLRLPTATSDKCPKTLASQQQDTGESHSSAPPSQPTRSRQAPVTSRCTCYVAMHPIRRGVMPTDRVHRIIDIKLARGFSRWHRPRRSAAGPGRAALH